MTSLVLSVMMTLARAEVSDVDASAARRDTLERMCQAYLCPLRDPFALLWLAMPSDPMTLVSADGPMPDGADQVRFTFHRAGDGRGFVRLRWLAMGDELGRLDFIESGVRTAHHVVTRRDEDGYLVRVHPTEAGLSRMELRFTSEGALTEANVKSRFAEECARLVFGAPGPETRPAI